MWRYFNDLEELSQQVAAFISAQAQQVLRQKADFHLVLAGGNTPQRTYQLLAKTAQDWSRWHFYLGDERCLPANHVERNSQMVLRNLTAAIPAQNLHFIASEQPPAQAATAYQQLLADVHFDWVLLGMGADGHTASLFPHRHYPPHSVFVVHNAPKPPATRISLSPQKLSDSEGVLFLISGQDKQPALKQWQNGAPLPVGQIHGQQTLIWVA